MRNAGSAMGSAGRRARRAARGGGGGARRSRRAGRRARAARRAAQPAARLRRGRDAGRRMSTPARTRVLYLAPWVDYGGSDKGTIDWFRWLDRSRFAPMLVTTQPSANRRLAEVVPVRGRGVAAARPDGRPAHAGVHLRPHRDARHRGAAHHELAPRLSSCCPISPRCPHPPKVVVQLHVEEEDRSGYVRLVAAPLRQPRRRVLGQLASISPTRSRATTCRVLEDPRHPHRRRRRGRVLARPRRARSTGSTDGAVHVLYPGRLVEQKDPLLMVEVAARAVALRADAALPRRRRGPARAGGARALVAERGLGEHVRFHPPTNRLARLVRRLRSAAHDEPLRGRALRGLRGDGDGPAGRRARAARQRRAARRRRRGADRAARRRRARTRGRSPASRPTPRGAGRSASASRARTLGELSVTTMARAPRGALRRRCSPRVLPRAPGAGARAEPADARARAARTAVAPRARRSSRSSCPASTTAATWATASRPCARRRGRRSRSSSSTTPRPTPTRSRCSPSSSDPTTSACSACPSNGGPSAARNAGPRACPRALRAAGRRRQHAAARRGRAARRDSSRTRRRGRRLHLSRTCSTSAIAATTSRRPRTTSTRCSRATTATPARCSTRQLFARRALRRADIMLGHEDWDLVLQLAERGRPRRARAGSRPCCYRKSGFTRSDTVEYGGELFSDVVRGHHPVLFGDAMAWGRWGKSRRPGAGDQGALRRRACRSSPCGRSRPTRRPGASFAGGPSSRPAGTSSCSRAPIATGRPRRVRRSCDASPRRWRRRPPPHSPTPAASPARRIVLVTSGTGSQLLEDRSFVEKLLRAMLVRDSLQATVLCDAGDGGSLSAAAARSVGGAGRRAAHDPAAPRSTRDTAPRRLRRGLPGSRRLARAQAGG